MTLAAAIAAGVAVVLAYLLGVYRGFWRGYVNGVLDAANGPESADDRFLEVYGDQIEAGREGRN